MKYVDEYRNPAAVKALAEDIRKLVTKPWTIMEVCGGQTHAIVRFGIDQLLPDEVTLVHGPGCPVCVTAIETIDTAIEIARQPGVIFCSFGDMLRVPGSEVDLLSVRAEGADVRTVYSPLDALELARQFPDKQVVFFAVGFETTAPATAMVAYQAKQQGVRNFSLLTAHVLVQPAMEAILSASDNRVQGFLAAGHVCAVTGYTTYQTLIDQYQIPVTVTGFEPVDIMQGIQKTLSMLERGEVGVDNQYARAVRPGGNPGALDLIRCVYEVCDRNWRGIGVIPSSGWQLREEYAEHDALKVFDVTPKAHQTDSECISGLVLQGARKPNECPAFGGRCTPEHPLGATMVSSEGACAAYYRYRSPAEKEGKMP